MLRGGRAFAVIGVPFPGPEDQPPGAVLTFHDVTEVHRVEPGTFHVMVGSSSEQIRLRGSFEVR